MFGGLKGCCSLNAMSIGRRSVAVTSAERPGPVIGGGECALDLVGLAVLSRFWPVMEGRLAG